VDVLRLNWRTFEGNGHFAVGCHYLRGAPFVLCLGTLVTHVICVSLYSPQHGLIARAAVPFHVICFMLLWDLLLWGAIFACNRAVCELLLCRPSRLSALTGAVGMRAPIPNTLSAFGAEMCGTGPPICDDFRGS
jgi:hypothetical protein